MCVFLCLIQKSDGASSKDFKKTKTRDSVAEVLKAFIGDNQTVLVSIGHIDTHRHNNLSQAMSTFSPVGSWSSNCVCCVDGINLSMQYVGISTYQFISYYVNAIHKHTHTRIKLFEDSEPMGLKVDIALYSAG